jgi:hypothetical protein
MYMLSTSLYVISTLWTESYGFSVEGFMCITRSTEWGQQKVYMNMEFKHL